jgi:glycerol-3-phosphate dehydrogenase (NAD(P)+)
MQIGVIGGGSWATALAKILTDNGQSINWWIRNESNIEYFRQRKHNPHYLQDVIFSPDLLNLSSSIEYVVENSDLLLAAIPASYVKAVFDNLNTDALKNKKIISAIKGILPDNNELFNEYLQQVFQLPEEDYFTVLGPCHAEEIAAEKLSYLTFSGKNAEQTRAIAAYFKTSYLNTIINNDVTGTQYAAVLKNIYALGAGIAHGVDYGDNFLSVFIANCAGEMGLFLRQLSKNNEDHDNKIVYSTSTYLGDLLVTCYSLHSRNRMFGNMIGKGYSVKAAQLELNRVAEGYNASRCMYNKSKELKMDLPFATYIYEILWEHKPAMQAFEEIEKLLY